MLDLKYFIDNPSEMKSAIYRLDSRDSRKKYGQTFLEAVKTEKKRLEALKEYEALQAQQNALSKSIGRASKEERPALLEQARSQVTELGDLKSKKEGLEKRVLSLNEHLPNIPNQNITHSPDKTDKTILYFTTESGLASSHSFDHNDLAQRFGVIDWEAGAKVSGSGFPFFSGPGARLTKALIDFFIDEAVKKGYRHIRPPTLVTRETMWNAGVYPAHEANTYETTEGLVMVPTAEVVLVGSFAGKTYKETDLPHRVVAYTPCYRSETGRGALNRGILRVHEFDKVELVEVVTPDQAYNELNNMIKHAMGLVEKLELNARAALLPSGDIGQQCEMTTDVEIYIPSAGEFQEVSSLSSCSDFQSRRGKIMFKPQEGGKSRLAYTLNGSALALPRVIAAMLETHYLAGKDDMRIPQVLRPYYKAETLLGK